MKGRNMLRPYPAIPQIVVLWQFWSNQVKKTGKNPNDHSHRCHKDRPKKTEHRQTIEELRQDRNVTEMLIQSIKNIVDED